MIFYLFLIRHKIASRFISFFWYVFLCIMYINSIHYFKKMLLSVFSTLSSFYSMKNRTWAVDNSRELSSITHEVLEFVKRDGEGEKLIASHEKNIVWHLSVCAFNLYCETETPAKMLKLPPTRYSTHGSAGEQLVLLMICWRFTIIV